MTTDKKVARRKLSLLELASDLGNVSKTCRVIGYCRQQFYEIRRNFQTYGADGLLDRLPGAKGPHPNRVAAEIRDGDPRSCLGAPLPRRDAGRSGADAARHPRLLRRGARGLAAPQSIDQARSPVAAGEGHRPTQAHPLRGTDQALGAVQPGIPRA